MSDRIQTFEAFWPYYLREHSKSSVRWLHWVGTNLAVATLVTGIVTLQPWYLLLALLPGYGFAWVSHFFIEKNRPATFKYPAWSLLGDFKMWALMWTGKLGPEVARHVSAAA
jgi:hypothetical protein